MNKRVRLIMGCNEETGSKCMEHYNEVAEELSCGLLRTQAIHVSIGEKGTYGYDGIFKNTKYIP